MSNRELDEDYELALSVAGGNAQLLAGAEALWKVEVSELPTPEFAPSSFGGLPEWAQLLYINKASKVLDAVDAFKEKNLAQEVSNSESSNVSEGFVAQKIEYGYYKISLNGERITFAESIAGTDWKDVHPGRAIVKIANILGVKITERHHEIVEN